MSWAEIWKISVFLSENFQFLVVEFSMYLNRRVFVMKSLRTCAKYTDADHPGHHAKCRLGLCSLFIHSVVTNDSVSRKWRPWSDCVDVQADLGLQCPHICPKTCCGMARPISKCDQLILLPIMLLTALKQQLKDITQTEGHYKLIRA